MNKAILSIFFILFVQLSLFAQTNEVLTNQSIVSLVEQGVGSDIIKAKIQIYEVRFDISFDSLEKLKKGGVPSDVIQAMHNRQTYVQHTPKVDNSYDVSVKQKRAKPLFNITPRSLFTFSAGMNVTTLTSTNDDYDFKSVIGYRAGMTFQGELVKGFPLYVGLGLYFSKKGASFEQSGYSDSAIDLLYLQIPLILSYRIALAENFAIVPSISYGYNVALSSKVKRDGHWDGTNKNHFTGTKGNDFDDFNFTRGDIGLTVGLGFAFKKLSVLLNYEFGFLSVLNDVDERVKNGAFTVSLEYSLFSKR